MITHRLKADAVIFDDFIRCKHFGIGPATNMATSKIIKPNNEAPDDLEKEIAGVRKCVEKHLN